MTFILKHFNSSLHLCKVEENSTICQPRTQAAQGSFPPDERIDRLVGTIGPNESAAADELTAVTGSGGLDVAYTALAVALLEQRYPGQAASWQLIAEKARRWLVKMVDDKAGDLLEAAAKLVRQLQQGHEGFKA